MKPTAVTLHHSATKDGLVVDTKAIRRFHTSWRRGNRIITPKEAELLMAQGIPVIRPWRGPGYHFFIEQVDDEYEIIVGRMMDEPGAHTAGYNTQNLGICFVGDFDKTEVPQRQWNLGVKLVRTLHRVFDIRLGDIKGHRQYARDGRTCPGRLFDVQQFRVEIAN